MSYTIGKGFLMSFLLPAIAKLIPPIGFNEVLEVGVGGVMGKESSRTHGNAASL